MAVWIKVNKEDISLEEVNELFNNPTNKFDIHYFDGTKGNYYEIEVRGFEEGQEKQAKKELFKQLKNLRKQVQTMKLTDLEQIEYNGEQYLVVYKAQQYRWENSNAPEVDDVKYFIDENEAKVYAEEEIKPYVGFESQVESRCLETSSLSQEDWEREFDSIEEIVNEYNFDDYVETQTIDYNYKHLCDYINEEELHYLEGIREEQDNFKKTPEFDDKIKEISDSLGFGKYINFEEKLREELINRDNVNRFSIPVTLNNKRTGDVATFNINMIYDMTGNVITYRPSILDYDLTLKKSNGEEKTLKFSYDNGELPNAKEAIAIIEKQMRELSKEEVYAYLIDDYGITTDISNRIKNITQEDLNRKRVFTMNADEYKQHFMLDISNETAMEGRLVTNAFYVICKGSYISEIEAPNAEEIRCDNCHNLEKITAENCIQVWAIDSNIKEENIEINYKGVIEGPELQKRLKL